jgi:hypothetical protein
MMFTPLHEQFGSFHFILEPISTPKLLIDIISSFSKMHLPSSRYITITSYDGRYPLPNPSFIAIHAAIGNILQVSGRGEIESLVLDLGAGGLGLVNDRSCSPFPACRCWLRLRTRDNIQLAGRKARTG